MYFTRGGRGRPAQIRQLAYYRASSQKVQNQSDLIYKEAKAGSPSAVSDIIGRSNTAGAARVAEF